MEIVALCLLGGALLGALIPGQSMAYAPYNIEGEPTAAQLDYLHQCYKQNKVKQRYGITFDEYVYTHMQQTKNHRNVREQGVGKDERN